MPFHFKKLALIVVFVAVFLLLCWDYFALGQEDLTTDCEWGKIEQAESSLSKEDFRVLLEKCKVYYEQKAVEINKDITKTQQSKNNLANKIAGLKGKIKSLDYQISQSNIMIKDLGLQISNTEVSIAKTSSKIDDIKDKLGTILQLRYEEDEKSTIEILFSEGKISDFFDNLMALEMLNSRTRDFLQNIKDLKNDLEEQKTSMDSEQEDLKNVLIIQGLQKQENSKNKSQQESLLKLTEQEYQKQLKEKKEAQEVATKIGSKLFELLEVPEGGIKFEDAVNIAKQVSEAVGIRPEFSLAVLWQETKIGKVQGGCYLKNESTGDGIYIKSGNRAPKTMSPKRDVPVFLGLVSALNSAGFLRTDAFSTPVSCCMIKDGSYFGWGGAMGPAQFIPSTWVLYKDEIEKNTGKSPANPWNVRDAFMANALLLRDNGASSKTYNGEILAALKYFGCATSWCRKYYGEPVMTVSVCLKEYIEKGTMSSSCQELVF